MKEVRPTTSKIIQAFFNILGNLDSCSFLDLFSGTGRVAWEARAHGASIVTVESVHERARQIHEKLGDLDHLCLCMDVRRALPWLQKRGSVLTLFLPILRINLGGCVHCLYCWRITAPC